MESKITKFCAAQRQLATAIELFFACGDPISIYTLTNAARIVVDNLCDHHGIPRFLDAVSQTTGLSKPNIYRHINGPANFFKHADRDPLEALTDFEESELDALILTASGLASYRSNSSV
jgi:hypothetical protein